MNAIIFDTLKLSKALQGEFTAAQAEKLTFALAESTLDTVATKADISDLRVDIARDFSLLRADLVRWVVTAIAFNFVAVAGLVIALVKVFGR